MNVISDVLNVSLHNNKSRTVGPFHLISTPPLWMKFSVGVPFGWFFFWGVTDGFFRFSEGSPCGRNFVSDWPDIILLYSWRFSRHPFIGYFMVTWHLTLKLFPAKCHERATLRKLWRQTGNSSLLAGKCWPPLHVIAGISARFSNFAFVLFCYITNHLMTGTLGNSEFCFPQFSMFPSTSSRET